MKLRGACVQTHNIEIMVDFYKKIFGYDPDIDGGVDYRFYDDQVIIFKLTDAKAPSTKDLALIYAVDDVDREYERLINLGIEIKNPPTDKPWGVKSFVINDPDGNTISFFANLL